MNRRVCAALVLAFFLAATCGTELAQQVSSTLYSSLRWRLLGPFRAGRVTAVSGAADDPTTYYFATPNGGVWKTTNAGRTWRPIFDEERVASIGALAVAPSDSRIIYVGTGEQVQGDGVYKSINGGDSWTSVGLAGTHVINAVLIDPRNPNLVLVAASGDHNSGVERGVYKTSDGGRTWQKTLFRDAEFGAVDLSFADDAPSIVYAVLWRRPSGPPGERNEPREQDAAIYKSTDEGSTWTQVTGRGLPSERMGRVGVVVAPGARGNTVYAIAEQGFYRSDDGGANWIKATTDPRILGNSYFSRVFVDPKNANIVYLAQTSMYRSADGGRTWTAWAGAPSGDDYHVLWINPREPRYMIAGVDQGAIVSVDGGATWSSWYNQATGQFYHVSTDDGFPYRVYAAQQDSGTVATVSRSDYGEITYRDWAPVGGFEFAFIAPDPANPNFVYTGGWYGSVLRYDRTTGQVVHVFVRTERYHTAGMAPIVFSPQDPHTLYVGAQYVMKTTNGGESWQEISPDLTAEPKKEGERGGRNPVINTLAVSRVQAGEMWAGTSNGLIQVTREGKSWQNVTPPNLPPRSSIEMIEASRHDAGTAYAVMHAFQVSRPMVYRTRDFGQTWQPIITGLQENAIAWVVREDPVRKGLLFCGTENAIYVSFDDGDHWQSLQLNLPITTVRDLDVHGSDLLAATYGRSLWVLDNITPLRQADAAAAQQNTVLFLPAEAVRTRWDMNQDTPLPIETPAAKNPPDGAIIDYFLKPGSASDLKLQIFDSQNRLVREFTTTPPPEDNTPLNVPDYWFARPAVLPINPGHNRFVWDLRYEAPKTLRYSYFGNHLDYVEYTLADHAVPGETPRQQPQGPLVVPGDYRLVLTANGQRLTQALRVTLDPRVHVSQEDLVAQLDTERSISAQMEASFDAYDQTSTLRAAIADRKRSGNENPQVADALKTLDEQVDKIENGTATDLGVGPINRELARLAAMIQSGDARPAAPLRTGVDDACHALAEKLAEWRELNRKLSQTNQLLLKQSTPALPVARNIPANPSCGR